MNYNRRMDKQCIIDALGATAPKATRVDNLEYFGPRYVCVMYPVRTAVRQTSKHAMLMMLDWRVVRWFYHLHR